MNMYDIIDKKKNLLELESGEIDYFIKGYTNGSIPDYQASALLMAIYFAGMDEEETLALTKAMMNSGDVVDLSQIKGTKVDKHSTGGVGDKTTLVLIPMLAACGISVAKMSGRSLGHTGGTIDKLESIRGFRTEFSEEEFIGLVNKHGAVVASQSADIAPADKKLYALRDVTATVNSIPLIASSVMSKKLASGSDAIVLDVKMGSGSFSETLKDAETLARTMVEIGKGMNRSVSAVISDMNQPLGHAVGNALEVREAIEILNGRGPGDILRLCVALGANLMKSAGVECDADKARQTLVESISSGRALEKLIEIVSAQGGDENQIYHPELLPLGAVKKEVLSDKAGYVSDIKCNEIGMASLMSGAGRRLKDETIDYGAGIVVHKKLGDYVSEGEAIATLYTSSEERAEPVSQRILSAYSFSSEKPEDIPLIYGVIN